MWQTRSLIRKSGTAFGPLGTDQTGLTSSKTGLTDRARSERLSLGVHCHVISPASVEVSRSRA